MKSRSSIFKNNKIILRYIGILTIIIGIIVLLPLIVIIAYPNESKYAIDFIIPSFIAISIGFMLSYFIKLDKNQKLSMGQDTIIVVIVWILASFFSAIPFIISKQLNFTQAYFEAVSGWTTTGLSVVDVEVTPKIYLMHRSIMQFFGGVGLVLVMVSALSETFGMNLYSSEGHSDKLLPNLLRSSRMIMSIYVGYIIAGTVLYYIFGMPLFDGINHSIAALSTGGFGIKRDSVGAYKSFSIELITIILMILGTTNFAAHLLLVRGKFKKFFKIGEVRFMFLLLGVSIPLATFFSLKNIYGGFSKAFRISAFQMVSALSTTGFSTVSFNNWNSFSIFTMIILMIIGGGAGSTAGGIKIYRVYLMVKTFLWNLKKKFMPEHMVNENFVFRPEGKIYIKENNILEASNYAFIYIVLLFIGTGIIVANGYSLQDALFEFASSIGTVGLSVGITSPIASPIVLWTEIFGMLFGRLEIYVIFIAVIKIAKDVKGLSRI
ncbi:TrkH family potassium uptake protein [Clostridium sporogenes]|uniref:TrkH family potassium uptake protein n=1 Tax=Clostridium sporogenes TaxID=1509 RepID=UPI0013D73EE0|nr:TrkH family potassium uptake protein [Clostridium sporogenes]MBA4507075.1 TrkH family potassium uptake protein [Clostridium sporogenes]MDU6335044.1 TrkH family potassium uptake protein [Clostridium sporogenes]NFQ87442.1 TrkH family potassium uptake protein [Clostridium sporogenes]